MYRDTTNNAAALKDGGALYPCLWPEVITKDNSLPAADILSAVLSEQVSPWAPPFVKAFFCLSFLDPVGEGLGIFGCNELMDSV
jgi:hypothetical protein